MQKSYKRDPSDHAEERITRFSVSTTTNHELRCGRVGNPPQNESQLVFLKCTLLVTSACQQAPNSHAGKHTPGRISCVTSQGPRIEVSSAWSVDIVSVILSVYSVQGPVIIPR